MEAVWNRSPTINEVVRRESKTQFLLSIKNHWEVFSKILDEGQVSRSTKRELWVDIFPQPINIDMPGLMTKAAKFFPNIKKIKIVFLADDEDDDDQFYDFEGLAALLFAYKQQLESLEIRCNKAFRADHDLADKCVHTTYFISELCQLEKLKKWNVHSTVSKECAGTPFYHSMLQALGSLQTVNSIRIHDFVAPSAPILSRALRELDIYLWSWGPEWLACLLEQSLTLERAKLHFQYYEKATENRKWNGRLGKALANHRSLTELDIHIGDCSTDVWSVINVFALGIRNNTTLKSIIFRGKVDGARNEKGLRKLYHGLAACSSLRSVETSFDLNWLPELLQPGNKLQSVACFESKIEDISSEFSAKVADAISSENCKLEELMLSCPLQPAIHDWQRLVSVAVEFSTLSKLQISATLPEYASLIGNALVRLPQNKSLLSLHIDCDLYGAIACFDHAFAHSMRENFTIQSMELTGLDDNETVSGNCNIVCELNKAGRKYMLESNTIQNGVACLTSLADNWSADHYDWWKHASHLDCIFFHLRENAATFFGSEQSDALELEIRSKKELVASLKQQAEDEESQLAQLTKKQNDYRVGCKRPREED